MPSRTFLTHLYNEAGQPIMLGQPIGHGKEGTVYPVLKDPSIVAKIFHHQPPPEDTQHKLLYMIANPPSHTTNRHYSIAWPISTITRTKRSSVPIGYTMPTVAADQYHEIGAFFNPARRRQLATNRGKPYSYLHLINMAHNVALATAHIHEHQHLVGDFNSRNILANDHGRIAIIDTDSFQVHNTAHDFDYISNVGTPEYTAPSMQGVEFDQKPRTTLDDLFALAVLIYQLFFQGQHPYNGIYHSEDINHPVTIADRIRLQPFVHYTKPEQDYSPAPHVQHLWKQLPLKRLFRTAFTNTSTRVPAATWADAIADCASRIGECKRNPYHHHFGRPCTWCAFKLIYRTDVFPKTTDSTPDAAPTRRSRFINS